MSGGRARAWADRWLALPALFAALAVVMVRPRFDRLPDNPGDPALIIWIMSWAGRGLATDPSGVFDGPMFWPHDGSFTYADMLITPAVPYWALQRLTGSWTAALVGVTLLLTVLAEAGAYLAALRITGRRDASVIAAIAFAFSGYAMGRWASLQLASIGVLALCLVAFLHLLDRPTAWRAILLGLAIVATFYASAYYGALVLLLLGVLGPAALLARLVRRGPARLRLLGGLALAAVVAGIGILPTALTVLKLQDELHLSRPLAPEYDLVGRDLVRPAQGSYVWEGLDAPAPDVPFEHRFFPGAIATGLAVAGIFAVGVGVVRRRLPVSTVPGPAAARDLAVLAGAGIVSLVLATGSSGIGPFAPWALVHDHVPGFGGIRATSRLAVPGLLLVAVLAALGYATATDGLRSRRPLQVGVAVLCSALMLGDLSATRQWARLDTSDDRLAVYRALVGRPAGAVLELPIPDPRVEPLVAAYQESPRLVYSTLDWHPRVNGYSGFVPPEYYDDIDAYRRFPERVATDRLKVLGVRYVILHVGDENGLPALSEGDAADRLRRLPPGASATRLGSAHLVDLGPVAVAP